MWPGLKTVKEAQKMTAVTATNICPVCGTGWEGEGICPDCSLDQALEEMVTVVGTDESRP